MTKAESPYEYLWKIFGIKCRAISDKLHFLLRDVISRSLL